MNKKIFLLIFFTLSTIFNAKSMDFSHSILAKSIRDLRSRANGIYELEAHVITISRRCKCPENARCKCAPSGILISDDAKVQNQNAPWGTTKMNELFLECNPDLYQLGDKKSFIIQVKREMPGRQAYRLVN